MKYSRTQEKLLRGVFVSLLLLASATVSPHVSAQSDMRRETVAITYPLDQNVSVRFRGTTRLPRLTGEAKVRRSGRRGTRVELSLKNLPRAIEVGGVYSTFVLWAITPEGRADNLGEIKRSGSFIVNSKLDVTTPLQTFALIVTAEPHFLVRSPSRAVVLENLPPNNPGDATVDTVSVRYIGNTSDYLSNSRVPEIADADYVRTPTSLLGARQAINLARFAGAERDATAELKEATDQIEIAENAWRLKQPDEDVDAAARRATSLAMRAEEVAESRKAARQRREEIARRDDAVRDAERSADSANQEIANLRAALQREERARELSDRDLSNANQQVRELRTEVARLRDEMQAMRSESEDAKLKLARIEGERSAEVQRQEAQRRLEQQQQAAATLRQSLARYGTVRDTGRGITLVLPDNLWSGARAADLAPASSATVEPLAALFANYPDFQILIEVYSDSRGDMAALRQLTQARADALAGRLVTAGVENGRVQATGMGTDNPVASNSTPAGRTRNRRTEITLVPINASSASANER
ncbi:MAG TPA: OmpA family protein [Pyrinomonadaceae bacterium]|jgi:outer membrane protein OmpA-like peptidoglycan-associated protein